MDAPPNTGNSADAAVESLIKITEFEQEHLSQVCEIENSSFSQPFSADYFKQLAQLYPETFLVAEKEDRVLGYVVADTRRGVAHILSIAVREDGRRRCVGLTLMRALIEKLRLREIKEILLEVRKSNVAARSMYERLGFELVGNIRGYYGGEDAALYNLKLC